MQHKEITVQVAGRPGSGKSTVAEVIRRALSAAGITAHVVDDLDGTMDRLGAMPQEALNDRMLSLRASVTVRTVQVRRLNSGIAS